jgi:phosphonate transport system substrate-binding protein
MRLQAILVFFAGMAACALVGASEPRKSYSFGVVNQRSAAAHARYWKPILRYVANKSGVQLQLKLAKTVPAHAAMIRRGEFDFVYSSHTFTANNDGVGYRVIARPLGQAMRGQIVVPAQSPVQSLRELDGREVVFPSRAAFFGYFLPMDALVRAGVQVHPHFAGSQEATLAQLQAGRVVAAAVDSQLMRDYAERKRFAYRILWSSEPFLNIPISAHPSVPQDKVREVRDALVGMSSNLAGLGILAESAALVKQHPPHGFVTASDRDFDNYRHFFRNSVVKD